MKTTDCKITTGDRQQPGARNRQMRYFLPFTPIIFSSFVYTVCLVFLEKYSVSSPLPLSLFSSHSFFLYIILAIPSLFIFVLISFPVCLIFSLSLLFISPPFTFFSFFFFSLFSLFVSFISSLLYLLYFCFLSSLQAYLFNSCFSLFSFLLLSFTYSFIVFH